MTPSSKGEWGVSQKMTNDDMMTRGGAVKDYKAFNVNFSVTFYQTLT